jgi:hypothetical protein
MSMATFGQMYVPSLLLSSSVAQFLPVQYWIVPPCRHRAALLSHRHRRRNGHFLLDRFVLLCLFGRYQASGYVLFSILMARRWILTSWDADNLLRSSLYAHFSESLAGLSTIRAFGECSRFVKDNENLYVPPPASHSLTDGNIVVLTWRIERTSSLSSTNVGLLSVLTFSEQLVRTVVFRPP